MGRALHALGLVCARLPWIVLGVWFLIGLAIAGLVAVFGTETSNDLELPGTESQQVQDLLTERFPPQQNGTNPIVFHVDSGKLSDDHYHDALKTSVQQLSKAPHVYSVTAPLSSAGQAAGLVSKDGRTAFAPVLLDIGSGELDEESAQAVFDATKPAQDAGIQVEAAGSIGSELSDEPTESSEVIGILCAMVILTLVLGSLVAMGLPILSAVVGLGAALALVGLLGHLVSVPDTGATLATMIGLGVGIDYALFLITRHQELLKAGVPMEESIARSVATSGSAIVFAGGTVVVALVALRVAGIPLLSTLGLASAVAVLTAVLAAISLLPALLGLIKHRINWLSVPKFGRKEKTDGGLWARWAGVIGRHPAWATGIMLAVLIPLIIPATTLQFGQEDLGAAPEDTTQRRAYDLITAGFGPGYNGPLQVASKLEPPASPSDEYTKKYNQATSMQKQLEQLSKELPKQQQQLEAQQKQLEAQQKQLEAEQKQLEAEGASLAAQADELTRGGNELKAQKADLQKQQRKLEAEKKQLKAEKKALKKKVRALAKQARPLIRELGRLTAHQRALERRIANTDDPVEKARLQARLDRVLERKSEVKAELAPLKKEGQQLADQARKLEKQAKQLEKQADQLKREADQLQQQADQLQREGDELERQKAALERQGAELQKQGDQLQQAGAELQQQADDLKAQQQAAQQEQKQAEQLQQELTTMVTAAGGDPRNTDPRVVDLQKGLSNTKGVLTLTPPQTNKKGDVVLLSAVPTTAPATDETAELLVKVRSEVVPEATKEGGITSYVGGYTASYADLATLISERLLLVIGTVILLGFVLLMIAFRSILVPLQAAVTNVLSAGAAFGILTVCFQWGWGIDLVGLDTASDTVPIASYVPLMMFAVLFGLSMDYEVFLVSHIQQHHLRGEPARQAAVSGLRTSARITTAACLIMTSVFASFILNGDPTIKQFGVGLASAVLLAGILVITLAPASIMLMGEGAWWLPRWLDRVLPHIDIEGEGSPKHGDLEDPEELAEYIEAADAAGDPAPEATADTPADTASDAAGDDTGDAPGKHVGDDDPDPTPR